MIQKAEDIKFRCSSLGHLMVKSEVLTAKQFEEIKYLQERPKQTDKQKEKLAYLINKRDNPDLADGVKAHLADVFVSAVYKRKEDASGKQIEKGNEREEDGITLLSRIDKKYYQKNDLRLENDFISGECDLYLGPSIKEADETIDTKLSWSLNTFYRAKVKKLDSMYYWQGVGYMWLTGAKKHTVVHAIVNGTERAINDEKRKLGYSMGVIDPDNDPIYKEKCKQIEINHIFDLQGFIQEYPHFDFANDISSWPHDVPMEERLNKIEFERNEKDILLLQKRITECRNWMNKNLFNQKNQNQ